uniref:RNA-dependent RNA polymerase n=1 Tax=Soybean thrips permutotetra-like virus 1 TaxID=2802956 RepID=A0A7T8JIN3_9VIRU|nr:RNA-dependent RNA polymerase [Soybean thrips permutotetra-like virus 1]
MDTSNPVISGDRTLFGALIQESVLLKRQDFSKLSSVLKESTRSQPAFLGSPKREVDRDLLLEARRSGTLAVEKGPLPWLPPDAGPVAVSERYHTKGVNQAGKFVSVQRVFKVTSRPLAPMEALATYSPTALLNAQKIVYSTGTKSGFSERLKKWYFKRVPNPKTVLSEEGFTIREVIGEHLPHSGELPNWHGEVGDLLRLVEINKHSSAGPPFYRSKRECSDEIVRLLGDIVRAANREELQEFLKNEQEILLSECKNKQDRYKIDEIETKTRPYWNFCTAIQVLFSFLAQSVMGGLKLFTDHPKSWNGYGHVWANGGGSRIHDWASNLKEGQAKCAIYGDDVFLVFMKRGVIYAVHPDFSQMDASIHKNFANAMVDYHLELFEKQHGENNFWKQIGQFWKQSLVGGRFIVSGTATAERPDNGLLTGCVGTTLLDTIASMCVYKVMIHKKTDLFSEKEARKVCESFGFCIKEGTWDPQPLQLEPEEGAPMMENPWLGAQLRYVRGSHKIEPIPFRPQEELESLICNPRIPEGVSKTGMDRYLFDMARGYQLTAAFWHPQLWDGLCDLISRTPDEVVAMAVQSGAKNEHGENTGSAPESTGLVEEGWAWPSSDGWPTREFCLDVYLSQDNKLGGVWVEAFPELGVALKEMRKFYRPAKAATPRESTSWAVETTAEEVETVIDNKRNPLNLAELDVAPLTREKFNFKFRVVHKPYVKSTPKISRITQLVEDLSEISHQALTLLFPFGERIIAQAMVNKGFVATDEGTWSIDKTKETSVQGHWSGEAWSVLRETHQSPSPINVPESQPLPTRLCDYIRTSKARDTVSKVTGGCAKAGVTLKTSTEVLQQAPHDRVRVSVRILLSSITAEIGMTLATKISKNSRQARDQCFEEIWDQAVRRGPNFVPPHSSLSHHDEDQDTEASPEDGEGDESSGSAVDESPAAPTNTETSKSTEVRKVAESSQ